MNNQRINTIDDRLEGFFVGDYYALTSVLPRALDGINDSAEIVVVKKIDYNKEEWHQCTCKMDFFQMEEGIKHLLRSCECIGDLLIVFKHKGKRVPVVYCSHCLVKTIRDYWTMIFQPHTEGHNCHSERGMVKYAYQKNWVPDEQWELFVPRCGDPLLPHDGCGHHYHGDMGVCNPKTCAHKVHYCSHCRNKIKYCIICEAKLHRDNTGNKCTSCLASELYEENEGIGP